MCSHHCCPASSCSTSSTRGVRRQQWAVLPEVVRLVSDRHLSVSDGCPPLLSCRFLQRKFDEGGAAAVGRVLPEVLEALPELMVDPFGDNPTQLLLDKRMCLQTDGPFRFSLFKMICCRAQGRSFGGDI